MEQTKVFLLEFSLFRTRGRGNANKTKDDSFSGSVLVVAVVVASLIFSSRV